MVGNFLSRCIVNLTKNLSLKENVMKWVFMNAIFEDLKINQFNI